MPSSSSSGDPAGGGDEAAGHGGMGVLDGGGGPADGIEYVDVSSEDEDSCKISKEIENLKAQLAMRKKELQYSQENKKLRAELALKAKDMEHLIKENEELKAQNKDLQNNIAEILDSQIEAKKRQLLQLETWKKRSELSNACLEDKIRNLHEGNNDDSETCCIINQETSSAARIASQGNNILSSELQSIDREHPNNGKAVQEPKEKKTKDKKELDRALAAADVSVLQRARDTISTPSSACRRSTRSRAATGLDMPPSGQLGNRKRARQEFKLEAEEEQSHEEQPEQQAQTHADAEVRLRDLTTLKSAEVKTLRFVPVGDWFPPQRDEGANPRFWTVLQESFHSSYSWRKVSLSEHKTLNWHSMQVASGGVDVRPHFEAFPGLSELLTGVDRYVEEWVRDFYATVWISPKRDYIQFMFQGEQFKLYKNALMKALGIQESDRFLHEVVYPNAAPPRRALVGGHFPEDDEIRLLFSQPLVPGSPRLPGMLTPEAKVIHMAMRRSLLPRIGNAEAITSIQQWLLLSILTHKQFDIVDLILCEVEDAIADGVTLARQQPYAHFISHILAHSIRYPQFVQTYQKSRLRFSQYSPAAPTDRRRGQRGN